MTEDLNLPVNNPSETVPGVSASDVVTSEGKENVADSVSLKEIVKQATGRDYPTDEQALEGIKNTYKMVGAVGKPQQTTSQNPSVPPELIAKLEEIDTLKISLQETKFYQEHPEYNTPETKLLISAMGKNPEDVIKQEVFKTAFEAIQAHKSENTKSVAMSNPRLGAINDKITQAKELAKSGNAGAAADAAVGAVIDLMNEGK